MKSSPKFDYEIQTLLQYKEILESVTYVIIETYGGKSDFRRAEKMNGLFEELHGFGINLNITSIQHYRIIKKLLERCENLEILYYLGSIYKDDENLFGFLSSNKKIKRIWLENFPTITDAHLNVISQSYSELETFVIDINTNITDEAIKT